MAIRMGLREANQNFSKAIKFVRAGKEVVLTERGDAIAVIRPLGPAQDSEQVIERLYASGFLRAASAPGPLPRWKPRLLRGEAVARTLQRERDER